MLLRHDNDLKTAEREAYFAAQRMAKEQDGMSRRYMLQRRSILRLFAKAFPGPIMHVKGDEINWRRPLLT